MRRALLVTILLGFVSSACLFDSSPEDANEELTEIAGHVEEATYAAVYRFGFVRQFAPGITTRMEIAQQPPTRLRKLETTTKPEGGKEVKLTAWYVTNADGDFACSNYGEIGVRCLKDPIARATFNSAKLDVFFDQPRSNGAFSSVRKASRTVRYQGHQATCYEAVPLTASPAPDSPAPPTERFRFELCYAEDGILLRGRRTTLDEEGSDTAESFVEIVKLSRVVEAADLRLPGPVIEPDELPR